MPIAYVLINCESGSESIIIRELKRLSQVVEVSKVDGSYDLIAKVTADTVDKVKEVISLKIRGFEQIRTTLTLIAKEEEEQRERKNK
ncbi:MAG: Lrp/AsnC ligand binding domain-containing protein [Nitrososphaeraceae archaeon]